MRLDFNVLWIDDQPRHIKSMEEKVATLINKEGFKLVTRNVININQAMDQLHEDVFLDEVDLVLVDYDLGDHFGDSALRNIREKLPYRDIIFYSANAAANLKQLVFNQNVVGVYWSNRQDLVDFIYGVFETLVKKILDVDHSRGIVLGATSAIDVIVHDCILSISTDRDAQGKEALLTQARARISRMAKDYQKYIAEALEKENIVEVLNDRIILTADQKLRFLIRILRQAPEFEPIRKALEKYHADVIPKRNILAHAKFELQGKVYTTDGGKTIDSEDMKKLRQDLLIYRDVFNDLLEAVSIKE